jgi:mevalonate kinase
MVTASAPGKVILFGEHAVVYGEPAIAGAIERRIHVEVERASGGLRIHSGLKDNRYVEKAVEVVLDHLGETSGLVIDITSDLPPASGLGSSAAVSVATIMAVARVLGSELEKKEIADLGYQVELGVQGAASPTDTYTSTYGGIQYIQPDKQRFTPIKAMLPLVIGCTGMERSTKELVERVRKLRESFPHVISPIIKSIGILTRQAKKNLEAGENVGDLMNINHGLLETLGVSNNMLSSLVYTAREAGAKGAKLTGAGGGGCMIAYSPGKNKEVINAIEKCGSTAMKASISADGVRLEK